MCQCLEEPLRSVGFWSLGHHYGIIVSLHSFLFKRKRKCEGCRGRKRSARRCVFIILFCICLGCWGSSIARYYGGLQKYHRIWYWPFWGMTKFWSCRYPLVRGSNPLCPTNIFLTLTKSLFLSLALELGCFWGRFLYWSLIQATYLWLLECISHGESWRRLIINKAKKAISQPL